MRLTYFHSTGVQGSSGWSGVVGGTQPTADVEVSEREMSPLKVAQSIRGEARGQPHFWLLLA